MSTIYKRSDEEYYCEIKEAYQVLDKDNDGIIKVREMGTIMKSFGICPIESDFQDLLKTYELENQGYVDFEIFLDIMKKRRKDNDKDDEMAETIKSLDRDGNGLISVTELKHMITLMATEKLNEYEVNDLICNIDDKKENYINIEEFVKMMISK
jgi:calmodulin